MISDNPNYLPKTLLPNHTAVRVGVRVSTYGLWGDTNNSVHTEISPRNTQGASLFFFTAAQCTAVTSHVFKGETGKTEVDFNHSLLIESAEIKLEIGR